MNNLCALGIAGKHNLAVGALGCSLIRQRRQCRSSCRVAALKEACNISSVIHALYAEVIAAKYGGKNVKKGRTGNGANVSRGICQSSFFVT